MLLLANLQSTFGANKKLEGAVLRQRNVTVGDGTGAMDIVTVIV